MTKKITAVLFSPTGGTKRYCEELAKRLSADYEILDFFLRFQAESLTG